MFYTKQFCALIFTIHLLSAMDNQYNANYKPLPLKPLLTPLPSSSGTASSDLSDQVEDDGQLVLSKTQLDEMAYVLQQAPRQAQMIIEHLKDPTCLEDDEYRSAIFVGEPGTGKTMTALAIAHTMMVKSGWKYKMLESGAFLGKFRNQTAIKLRQFLRGIVVCGAPVILIIDELNRLLEHASSEHHDTDTASTTLWTFLDKQRGNQQFFFIGTMNDITKLPKPYKDRILFECIKFVGISEPLKQAKVLRYYLTRGKAQLEPALTNAKLSALLANIGSCSGRILKKMAGFIKRLYREYEQGRSETMVIPEELVDLAIEEFEECKKEIEYNRKDETDAERQDRYHQDSMAKQEKHFLQQQLKQDLVAEYSITDHHNFSTSSGSIAVDYTKQVLKPEGAKRIQELFSPEQNEIIATLKAQTTARLAKEAQEKAQRDAAAAEKKKNSWWQ